MCSVCLDQNTSHFVKGLATIQEAFYLAHAVHHCGVLQGDQFFLINKLSISSLDYMSCVGHHVEVFSPVRSHPSTLPVLNREFPPANIGVGVAIVVQKFSAHDDQLIPEFLMVCLERHCAC